MRYRASIARPGGDFVRSHCNHPIVVVLGLPDEEATQLYDALSGVPIEQPVSSARRVAETFAQTIVASMSPAELARVDTLAVTFGISRETMLERLAGTGIEMEEKRARALGPAPASTPDRVQPTTPPERLTLAGVWAFDPLIAARWEDLIEEARSRGETVGHCRNTGVCIGGARGITSCACRCEGCAGMATLCAQAERDVYGSGH